MKPGKISWSMRKRIVLKKNQWAPQSSSYQDQQEVHPISINPGFAPGE